MELLKRHKGAAVFLILCIIFLAWYVRMPDYEIRSSYSVTGGGARDTKIGAVVYKAWWDPELPEEIAEDFVRINGRSASLEICLYRFPWSKEPYKIVQAEL